MTANTKAAVTITAVLLCAYFVWQKYSATKKKTKKSGAASSTDPQKQKVAGGMFTPARSSAPIYAGTDKALLSSMQAKDIAAFTSSLSTASMDDSGDNSGESDSMGNDTGDDDSGDANDSDGGGGADGGSGGDGGSAGDSEGGSGPDGGGGGGGDTEYGDEDY